MEFNPQAVEREMRQLAKSDEEALGRIIGIAAVVALLPGTANLQVSVAKEVIAELMRFVVGAGTEVPDIAIRTAYVVITAAQNAQSQPSAR